MAQYYNDGWRGGTCTPQGEQITLTANGTFGPYTQSTTIEVDSDGAYNLAAEAGSAQWVRVTIINISAHTITLTSPTPNQSLPAGGMAELFYNGTIWR